MQPVQCYAALSLKKKVETELGRRVEERFIETAE